MKIEDYPKLTIILRNYNYEEIETVMKALLEYKNQFAVEITLNTDSAIEYLRRFNLKYGHELLIGAGTVRTIEEAKRAIASGARFLLGPHSFSKEMIQVCKDNEVLAIPSGMTPSEINNMFLLGADIVKVFPASIVSPRFFKDIQAPLGDIPLMAVGGISVENSKEFINNRARYLGIGSSAFKKEDIKTLNIRGIKDSLEKLLKAIK